MKYIITSKDGITILAICSAFVVGMLFSEWTQVCPGDKEIDTEVEIVEKVECTLARARYTDASLAAFVAKKMPVERIESCTPIIKWLKPSCESATDEAWSNGWDNGYSEGMSDGWKTLETVADDKTPDRTIFEPRNFRNSKYNANMQ